MYDKLFFVSFAVWITTKPREYSKLMTLERSVKNGVTAARITDESGA